MKVGVIYAEMARRMRSYGDRPNDADPQACDYDELEAELGLEKYIRVILDVLREQLNDFWEVTPSNYLDYVLHGAELYTERVSYKLSDRTLGRISFEILSKAHDLWVSRRKDLTHFKNDRIIMLMPAIMLPADKLTVQFLTLVEPILSDLNLVSSGQALLDAQTAAWEDFQRKNQIQTQADLYALISRGAEFYAALTPQVAKQFTDSSKYARTIAEMVMPEKTANI